jgi:hypothetical protein
MEAMMETIFKIAVFIIGVGCGIAAKDAAVAHDVTWAIFYGILAVGCIALATGSYGGSGYKSQY